jgi:hypothetical protein
MAEQALLPDPTSLHLLHIETERSVITMVVRTTASEAKCFSLREVFFDSPTVGG